MLLDGLLGCRYHAHRQGIPNYGNTCYVNAALQLIFQLGILANVPDPKQPVVRELVSMYKQYCDNRVPNARKFLKELYKAHSQFAPYVQGDSHEVLCCVLEDVLEDFNIIDGKHQRTIVQEVEDEDLVEQCLQLCGPTGRLDPAQVQRYAEEYIKRSVLNLRKLSAHKEAVLDLLKAVSVQTVECTQCGYCSLNLTQHTNITLDLPPEDHEDDRPGDSALKLFFVVPSLGTKQGSVIQVTVDRYEDVSVQYIEYIVKELLGRLGRGGFGKNSAPSEQDIIFSFYSREFGKYGLKQIIQSIKEFQELHKMANCEDSSTRGQEVVQSVETCTSSTLTSYMPTPMLFGEQCTVERGCVVPETGFASQQDMHGIQENTQSPNLQQLTCGNRAVFKARHVVFTTYQDGRVEQYLSRAVKRQQEDDCLLQPMMVTLSLDGAVDDEAVHLCLYMLRSNIFEALDAHRQRRYLQECIIPHFSGFFPEGVIADVAQRGLALKHQFKQGGVARFCMYVQSAELCGRRCSTDFLGTLLAARVIKCAGLLTLEGILRYNDTHIEEVSGWTCRVCHGTGGRKSTKLHSTSRCLIINFKRFAHSFDQRGVPTVVKDGRAVDCPKELVVLGRAYDLKSVVVHYGHMQGGHYVNIGMVDGRYIMFDDESVSQVDPAGCKCNAQILLYERRE